MFVWGGSFIKFLYFHNSKHIFGIGSDIFFHPQVTAEVKAQLEADREARPGRFLRPRRRPLGCRKRGAGFSDNQTTANNRMGGGEEYPGPLANPYSKRFIDPNFFKFQNGRRGGVL